VREREGDFLFWTALPSFPVIKQFLRKIDHLMEGSERASKTKIRNKKEEERASRENKKSAGRTFHSESF
jgi:hypothetical protein